MSSSAREITAPVDPPRLFSDGGLDSNSDCQGQDRFRSRAEVQGGAHFLDEQ